MIKKFIILLLFLSSVSHGQVSSLFNLASGTMEMFTPIFDEDDNVYGYFSLFALDRLSQTEEKYEYVILDKNLNKVANGEFVDKIYRGIDSRYYTPDKVGNNLILTKTFVNTSGSVAFSSSRMLQLDTNTVLEPFYIVEDTLFKGFRDDDNLKKEQRKAKFINIPIAVNNGFIVIEVKKKMTKVNPSMVYFFNLNQEKLWEYSFGDNEKGSEYSLAYFDDSALVFSYTTHANKDSNIKLQQINTNTGKLDYSYILENVNSEYSYGFTAKKNGNRTILTGKISPYKVLGYDYQNAVGLFKIVLDGNGNEIFKKHFLWEEASEIIDIDKRGKVEEGYKLFVHSYFVLKDERIVVLAEKFKNTYNLLFGEIVKTTDFVILEFDKDFKPISAKTIEKDLSKFSSSDFLFSQFLNDEKDAVFFYQDYQKDSETKERNWVLGIVSIVGGEVSHEKIPMSSDDHYIYPYIAKEGYILLREYNKKSEFDEIRLERLNLN